MSNTPDKEIIRLVREAGCANYPEHVSRLLELADAGLAMRFTPVEEALPDMETPSGESELYRESEYVLTWHWDWAYPMIGFCSLFHPGGPLWQDINGDAIHPSHWQVYAHTPGPRERPKT